MNKKSTYIAIAKDNMRKLRLQKITAQFFVVISLMLLAAVIFTGVAKAQDLPPLPPPIPAAPSNDMDMHIPAQPTITENSENNNGDDFDSFFDNIFSSDPTITPEQEKQETAETNKKEEQKPDEQEVKPVKKKVRTKFAKKRPLYNYKSQKLPSTIYKQKYNSDNRHLPIAIYREDLYKNMQLAAARGDVNTMRSLNVYGNVSLNSPSYDRPLIINAVLNNQAHVVEWLLAKGVSPDTTDNQGRTAFDYASRHGMKEIERLLIVYGYRS